MLCWRLTPRRTTGMTLGKSLSPLGRMRNIPSILPVLPSAMILGSSFTPSESMQKLSSIVEAVKLEEQEGPQREAERVKKQMDDLEVARQKNQKTFRP